MSATVSVIIAALNEQSNIVECVASARAAHSDEIIVADGGSTDGTCELARDGGGRVVVVAAGRARQQNAAAEIATGDVLLFLHADNRLSSTSVQQVRQAVEDPAVSFGAFRQRIDAAGWLFRGLEQGNAWRVQWRGIPYGDQGIFIRGEVFTRVGGFPDEPLLEDLLLARKLRRMSWPRLLPGPLLVSARRWQRHGVVRQTLRNWLLLTAHRCGATPTQLASYYARHDRK